MLDLQELALMQAEYAAWLNTNEVLKEATGKTWDTLPELHAAVIEWSEALVRMRIEQASR